MTLTELLAPNQYGTKPTCIDGRGYELTYITEGGRARLICDHEMYDLGVDPKVTTSLRGYYCLTTVPEQVTFDFVVRYLLPYTPEQILIANAIGKI